MPGRCVRSGQRPREETANGNHGSGTGTNPGRGRGTAPVQSAQSCGLRGSRVPGTPGHVWAGRGPKTHQPSPHSPSPAPGLPLRKGRGRDLGTSRSGVPPRPLETEKVTQGHGAGQGFFTGGRAPPSGSPSPSFRTALNRGADAPAPGPGPEQPVPAPGAWQAWSRTYCVLTGFSRHPQGTPLPGLSPLYRRESQGSARTPEGTPGP